MVKYTKLIFSILLFSTINSMETNKRKREQPEKQEQQEPVIKRTREDEIRVLPDLPLEIWEVILKQVYFNANIIDEAKDIYEAIDMIEKYIPQSYLAIALVCKDFNALSITKNQWTKFEKEIREFYINYINSKFLQKREDEEGLYPKNEQWHNNATINSNIAKFIQTGKNENNLLVDITALTDHHIEIPAKDLKLISLLLFYGADPNLQYMDGDSALLTLVDRQLMSGDTDLSKPAKRQSPVEDRDLSNIVVTPFLINKEFNYMYTIKFLLKYGANTNFQEPSDRCYALYFAAAANASNKNAIKIINCLLQHGANPNLQLVDGETALHVTVKKYHPTENNNIETMRSLLEYGAYPFIKNLQGIAAIDIVHNHFPDFQEFENLCISYFKQRELKN